MPGERDQREAAEHEAAIADRPHKLAADAVGEMAERDLSRHRGEADETEGPGRAAGGETDLGQVFGLVHLHRVPDEEAAEIAEREPPEARRAQRTAERPIHRRPGPVDDIGGMTGGGARRAGAVRLQPDILRPTPQRQVQRSEQH